MPRSYYMLRKALDCGDVEDITHQVCKCGAHYWGKLPPEKERSRCAAQMCPRPECGAPRFETQGKVLKPAKVFYYLGLQETINSLFCDTEFQKHRGVGRRDNGFYQSKEGRRLFKRAASHFEGSVGDYAVKRQRVDEHGQSVVCTTSCTHFAHDDPDCSVWELGLDWGEMFRTTTHSMGMVLLRCADLPYEQKCKWRFQRLLLIIPGPTVPQNVEVYLQPLLDDLARGHVRLTLTGEAGTVEREHYVLLGAVHGDNPAQKKVTGHSGCSAYLGCGFCLCRGVKVPGQKGGMYFPSICEYGMYAPGACVVPLHVNAGVGHM